jgi:C4-dicarboxylate-specific signal transduction histidine kinase
MPRSTSGAARRSSRSRAERLIAIHKGSYVSYGFDASRHRVFLRRRDNSREVNFMTGETVLSNAIAHEGTQPLTAIMANAVAGLRWLDRTTPELDEAKTAFSRIVADGQRLAAALERVQAILRTGDLNTTAFGIGGLVRETIKLMEDSPHRMIEE